MKGSDNMVCQVTDLFNLEVGVEFELCNRTGWTVSGVVFKHLPDTNDTIVFCDGFDTVERFPKEGVRYFTRYKKVKSIHHARIIREDYQLNEDENEWTCLE